MVELVDTYASGAYVARRGSSSLPSSTLQILVLIMTNPLPTIIVVCGPTATGKSDYAVTLAREINGEVISADSRQVYRGLDIGSGKITTREMRGVPHHLLDIAHPRRTFSVAQFQAKGTKIIADILKRGKTPIVCGGSGFYIDALIYNQSFPKVSANTKLRRQLQKYSLTELQQKLYALDPARYETIDIHNSVRLIRAIEIATVLGAVPVLTKTLRYKVQWIYLDFPDQILKERIHTRLLKRMKSGMLKEVQHLHNAEHISWKRLESFGLEYRYLTLYLQKKITKEEMLVKLEQAIWHYAKRQRTWFKKYAK